MRQLATSLLGLLLAFVFVGQVAAQTEVTIREINAISQDNIDALEAAGTDLQSGDVGGLIYNELSGEVVKFTAIIMTDPKSSGLSNQTDGRVDRLHVFVRDVAAGTEGPEGHGLQLVDGNHETTGLGGVLVGDCVEIVGEIAPFGNIMQVAPETVTLIGDYTSCGLDESIFDPITVTSSDINKSVGEDGASQVNWSNLPDLRNNYVRIENALVLNREVGVDRPNMAVRDNATADGGVTQTYETSLLLRNDRGDYPSDFNVRDDEYEPPPPGAIINLQGYLTYNGGSGSDPFAYGIPFGDVLALNPFIDVDIEITETPPVVSLPSRPDGLPGATTIDISTDVTVDPSRSLTMVVLRYFTSSDATEQEIEATSQADNTYTFTVPAANDGDFVTYWVVAEDNTGAFSETDRQSYRVLTAVDEVSDIQLTADEGPGDSPLTDLELDMDITATVQTDPAVSGFLVVQEGTSAWSGIAIEMTDEVNALGLMPGDVIRITHGTVTELRGPDNFSRSGEVTGISTPTVELVSTGGAPLADVVVSTDVLADPSLAEAHESMVVFIDDPIITNINPDAPSNFGEFSLSTDGSTENEIRVDDQSDSFDGSFNENIQVWERLDFIRGVWSETFGNYKLMPEDSALDIGAVTNVGLVDETVPGSFVLHQNYPNPFNPTTSIRFELAQTGPIQLQVFDLLGRQVMTLVDGEHVAGTHNVTLNASALSSGLYVYRLTAGNEVITRTMMLLK